MTVCLSFNFIGCSSDDDNKKDEFEWTGEKDNYNPVKGEWINIDKNIRYTFTDNYEIKEFKYSNDYEDFYLSNTYKYKINEHQILINGKIICTYKVANNKIDIKAKNEYESLGILKKYTNDTKFDELPFKGTIGKARSIGTIDVRYYFFIGGGAYKPIKTKKYNFNDIDVILNNHKDSFPKDKDRWTLDIKDNLHTYNFYLVYNLNDKPSRKYNFYSNLGDPSRFGFSYPSSAIPSSLSGKTNKESIKTSIVNNRLTIELSEFSTDFVQSNFAGYYITGKIEIEFDIEASIK